MLRTKTHKPQHGARSAHGVTKKHKKAHTTARRTAATTANNNTNNTTTTTKKSSSAVPLEDLSPELREWVTQKTSPRGMYGTVDNAALYNLGATINAPADSNSWIFNLGSGAHPAAHWAIASFSMPTSDLSADGYHDPVLTPPPKPFTARMWGGGEISYKRPMAMGANILQVASVDDKPQVKRTKNNGDIAVSTYTNRWCSAENPNIIHVEEKVNYVYRDPARGTKSHTPDVNVKQPVMGVDYDFERTPLKLDETTLFRYSALTWNSHRIHYDRDFAKSEGYDDLLVHGPLQATLALDLLGTVSEAAAPEEPSLVQSVYTALNAYHHANEKKQRAQHSHSHSHSHSHGGEPCGHDHGGLGDDGGEPIEDLPQVPWHTRFQQLRHFAYELKAPLYVNTPVRVLAKVLQDDFDLEEYEREILVAMENRLSGNPAKDFKMVDFLRNKPAYVRVWIQDEQDPSKVYFNATAYFDKPTMIHYNQVPEKGLDMLLRDVQDQISNANKH